MCTSPDPGAMLPDPRMATNLPHQVHRWTYFPPERSPVGLPIRPAQQELNAWAYFPPGAVPGRFATTSKGMGLLPPGAVPGRFAKMSEGMGLFPPGAVPGGFAKTSKGMGLFPPGAVPGGFAKLSLGALRHSSSSGKFGRRFCLAMGASSAVPAPNS